MVRLYYKQRDLVIILKILLSTLLLLIQSMSYAQPKIYWNNLGLTGGRIQSADLDGTNVEDVITGLVAPESMVIDNDKEEMFIMDNSDILKASLDGSNQQTIIANASTLFQFGLGLDRVNEKIYWPTGSHIARANYDGSQIENVISSVGAVDIAIDPDGGKIYWLDQRMKSVRRANIDGSAVETIVPSAFNFTVELALDLEGGKVYWGDYDGFIKRANLDGSNVEVVVDANDISFNSGGNHEESTRIALPFLFPRGLFIDAPNNMIYFTNGADETINTTYLDGSNHNVILDVDANGIFSSITSITLGGGDFCDPDVFPPDAYCKNFVVSLDANGMATISADDINAASTDDCMIASLQANPKTFDCSMVGIHVVVLTVTDIGGNTSSCNALVEVEDITPPVISCRDVQASLGVGGLVNLTASMFIETSSDNCEIDLDASTVVPNVFGCTDAGMHIVTVTVKDKGGNSTTCQARVEIVDKTPPTVLCKNTITGLVGPSGSVMIDPLDLDNGSFDNCSSSLEYTAIPAVFDCTDLQTTQSITLLVSDEAGNTAECLTTLEIKDEIAPTVVCKNATLSVNAQGSATANANDFISNMDDNCGIDMDKISITPSSFSCSDGLGARPATVTVTDQSGNSTSCQVEVTLVDNTPPEITCKTSNTLELDQNGNVTVVNPESFLQSSSDNCGGTITLTSSPSFFTCSDIGTQSVTIMATDARGNTSQCLTEVVIVDRQAPEVQCGSGSNLELDQNGVATINNPETLLTDFSDNCSNLIFSTDISSFSCSDIGSGNVVQVIVTDASGNSSQCAATVTVIDQLPPEIEAAANVILELDNDGMVELNNPDFLLTSIKDNCGEGNLIFSTDISSFSCADIGSSKMVTVSATDASGNTSQVQVPLQVVDKKAPELDCATEISLELDANGMALLDAPENLISNYTDNCDDELSFSADITSFSCVDAGTTRMVTITATDKSGNSSQCQVKVNIVDRVVPQVYCSTGEVVELDQMGIAQLNDPRQLLTDVSDNCGTDGLVFSANLSSFSCQDIGSGNTVLVSVSDASGNSNQCQALVTIVDHLPPEIEAENNVVIELDGNGMGTIGSPDFLLSSISDNCGTDGLIFSADINSFSCADVGAIKMVRVSVSDGSGNTRQVQVPVQVVDNQAPILDCSTELSIELDKNGMAMLDDPKNIVMATDNCDNQLDFSASRTTFTCVDIGIPQMVTITATDDSGNKSECQVIVNVVDRIAPTIRCKGDIILELDQNGFAEIDNPVNLLEDYDDNCGAANLVVTASQTAFDCTRFGFNFITVTVTDKSNNTSECQVAVEVVDRLGPELQCIQNYITFLDPQGNANLPAPESLLTGYSDNCPGAITFSADITTFSCADAGNNRLVTITGKDAHGSIGQCVVNVEVQEQVSPEIICFPNTTLELDQNGIANIDRPEDLVAFSRDNCDGPLYFTTDLLSFNCADTGRIHPVTVRVEDLSGNSASCVSMITVVDKQAPTIECGPGKILSLNENGKASLPSLWSLLTTLDDNCGTATLKFSTDSKLDFSCADLKKAHDITITVMDESKNVASCETVINVVDEIRPELVCKLGVDIFLDENGLGDPIPIAEDFLASYSDNCGTDDLEFRYSPVDLDCSRLGTNFVEVEAIDSSENKNSCVIFVHVYDTIIPKIMCRDTTIKWNLNDPFPLDPRDLLKKVEENCELLEEDIRITGERCRDTTGGVVYEFTVAVIDGSGNNDDCISRVYVMNDSLDCTITSTEEELEEDLLLYPNPVTETLFLKLPASLKHQQLTIRITDLSGRQIHLAVEETDSMITLSTHTLLPGIYFLTLSDQDGRHYTQKFIKN